MREELEKEIIGSPKEIEELEGFSIEDNKMLDNDHFYWKQTKRRNIL